MLALPSELQTRAAQLNGLPWILRSRGRDPDQVLRLAGLSVKAIEDPEVYLDVRTVVDTLKHCSVVLKDPLFGFSLARYQEPEVFGCIATLCRSAASLKECLEVKVRYTAMIHAPVSTFEITEGKETAEFRWSVRRDIGDNTQAYFQSALLNFKIIQQAIGQFTPSYVNLAVDVGNKDLRTIEKWLRCPVYTQSDASIIGFPRELLKQPVRTANKLVYALITRYLEDRPTSSFIESIAGYIEVGLQNGKCRLADCAEALDISARSLQFTLEHHGTSFSKLVEQQRLSLAQRHLATGKLNLPQIAKLVGFSQQAAFGRAFKRWTGMSPDQYRRRLRPNWVRNSKSSGN